MSEQERRRFHRVEFDVKVELSQHGLHWQSELVDISIKGALLAAQLPDACEQDDPIEIKVVLSNQTTITMQTVVAHQSERGVGLACKSIDVESIRHLRRLLELNLGSAEQAERELTELLQQ
ncbi:PilZ domain-containing protein [Gilvimarinus agarilyticus]|uniref:PilZ domain-containing protein n=1 Tax=unclassified Gilvimarinus TaxID=2642066 RepID=UPI001C08B9CD|nr:MULTISPECIES: PilZ domain-containing protein [unclassified Gilvimarinus]MBU2886532.1 PilZ domain-containing protein [Gilvimarinus agarilyticus]MDO6571200.1 PilZ domain-containing protein [Gilvimarinus sp. 2_MG-2023]MDO6746418.1 PilZ domain-containing protein [Gilvimarinus sp. 1_MG-2023]